MDNRSISRHIWIHAFAIMVVLTAAVDSVRSSPELTEPESAACTLYATNLLIDLIKLHKEEGQSYKHEAIFLRAELIDLLSVKVEDRVLVCRAIKKVDAVTPRVLQTLKSETTKGFGRINECLED